VNSALDFHHLRRDNLNLSSTCPFPYEDKLVSLNHMLWFSNGLK